MIKLEDSKRFVIHNIHFAYLRFLRLLNTLGKTILLNIAVDCQSQVDLGTERIILTFFG